MPWHMHTYWGCCEYYGPLQAFYFVCQKYELSSIPDISIRLSVWKRRHSYNQCPIQYGYLQNQMLDTFLYLHFQVVQKLETVGKCFLWQQVISTTVKIAQATRPPINATIKPD